MPAARLGQPDVSADVRSFTVGAAAAVTLLVVLERLAAVARDRGDRLRRAVTSVAPALAVVVVSLITWRTVGSAPSSQIVGWGAATMLGLAAAVGVARRAGLLGRAPVDAVVPEGCVG